MVATVFPRRKQHSVFFLGGGGLVHQVLRYIMFPRALNSPHLLAYLRVSRFKLSIRRVCKNMNKIVSFDLFHVKQAPRHEVNV